jgi:hypothetical protein
MHTHLGCKGSIELGGLSKETQSRLEGVEAIWLEFSPDPPSLVVRHVQPDAISAPREIAGELLDFLSHISDRERRGIPGGALYYLDEQSGQYFRLRVWHGGNLTVSWAHADYSEAKWMPYEGQAVPVVFEPYQCLNGSVRFKAGPGVAETIRATIERPAGLYPQGEYECNPVGDEVELCLRDVNSSAVPLVETLRQVARPGSLQGHIEVGSFRAGDLDDYCRFEFKDGDTWLLRPTLWNEAPRVESVAA